MTGRSTWPTINGRRSTGNMRYGYQFTFTLNGEFREETIHNALPGADIAMAKLKKQHKGARGIVLQRSWEEAE
jgi:hypothetical protein